MNKFFLLIALILLVASPAQAESDYDAIRNCLNAWGTHPFPKDKGRADKVLSPSVKVLGIGGRDIEDANVTDKASLVLIKPSVNVLSKSTFRLTNPKGWYCLKGTVAVLGKAEFVLHCKAKMATNNGDVAVLGKNENQEGGVAVLGSIRVKTIGDCN